MSWRGLIPILNAQLPPAVAEWFGEALQAVAVSGVEGEGFAARWSGLGRRLGRATLSLSAVEVSSLLGTGPFVPDGWGTDEAGRALLLLAGLGATPGDRQVAAVAELFRTGELREQQSIARVLAFLPSPARFAGIAVDAVRNNAVSLLEAIACENPFPAAHLTEGAFNQMVVKAMFNGVAVSRIVGLAGRRTPELVRMVQALVSERTAAGRPVPADAQTITGGDAHALV